MEQGYFLSLLKPSGACGETGWRGLMAEDVETRSLRMGLFTALRLRLRRNYLLLVYFIAELWITRIFPHPTSPKDGMDFYQRFLGPFPFQDIEQGQARAFGLGLLHGPKITWAG